MIKSRICDFFFFQKTDNQDVKHKIGHVYCEDSVDFFDNCVYHFNTKNNANNI